MVLATALAIAVIVTAILLYADARWRSATGILHTRLEAARLAPRPGSYDAAELEGLPAPVQRYFRAVFRQGQPVVAAVSLEQTGTLNVSESLEKWGSFVATQRVITRRPGFDWEARIALMPGINVRVHDAYIQGEGILHASLLALVSLVKVRGTPDMAQGEMMRFLAEAAWYPTALLPSQGVQWEAVDDSSAEATLRDGDTTATLLFRFGRNGLVESVRAEARGRIVADSVIPTPWEVTLEGCEPHDGMLVPVQGEVAWILPQGRKPYWRGRITRFAYEFAR